MIYNRKDGDVPLGAKYVGRPSLFGNPFSVETHGRAEAIRLYGEWLEGHDGGLYELRGKDLVCWCAPEPCHAEILDREANEGTLIAVTGHRPSRIGGYDPRCPQRLQIRLWLAQNASRYPNPRWVTGGALGVDQDAAREAYKNGQPFMVAAPCLGQESRWPQRAQEDYRKMLTYADSTLARRLCSDNEYAVGGTVYIHDGVYPGPWVMEKRNQWMVDHCDLLLAVWDGTSGGTANCVRHAEKVGKAITILNPTDL